MTPVVYPSMRMSAPLARRRIISWPAFSFRFTHTPFLVRLSRMNRADSPWVKGPISRSQSPSGGSILVTAAPRSPRLMAQSGPGTPCETSITLIPASARAIRPPYSAGRGSGGRRAGRDCRQTKLPQNFRLVFPQPRRGPRDRGHISAKAPVRPAHATRTPRRVDRLDHLVGLGLGMVVHEM